jgi:hypothetical protein
MGYLFRNLRSFALRDINLNAGKPNERFSVNPREFDKQTYSQNLALSRCESDIYTAEFNYLGRGRPCPLPAGQSYDACCIMGTRKGSPYRFNNRAILVRGKIVWFMHGFFTQPGNVLQLIEGHCYSGLNKRVNVGPFF